MKKLEASNIKFTFLYNTLDKNKQIVQLYIRENFNKYDLVLNCDGRKQSKEISQDKAQALFQKYHR